MDPQVIYTEDGSEILVLHHEGAVYFSSSNYIPYIQIVQKDQKISFYQILNLEFEDFSESEENLKDNINEIPRSLSSLKIQEKKPVSYLTIPTVYYDSLNDKLVKVKSFTINYTVDPDNKSTLRTTKNTEVYSSVLASGNWYKLGIPSKGIYKLSYEQLKKMGLPVENLDPRKIKIYGNGGGMLPQKNSENRHHDLVENAIFVSGEADGKFTIGDYILFYGQSADSYNYNSEENSFSYTKNLYSDSTYYFLTADGDPGLRIETADNIGKNFSLISVFDDYLAYENDFQNILGSGREWYGEEFGGAKLNYSFEFPVPGIVNNSELKLTASFLAQSYNSSSFLLNLNNLSVGNLDMSTISEGTYQEKGKERTETFTFNTSLLNLNEILILTTDYQRSSNIARGFLNYFFFTFQRNLQLYEQATFFRSISSLKNSESTFQVKNVTAASTIWDITDPLRPKKHDFLLEQGAALFGTSTQNLKEFVVFNESNFSEAIFIEKVHNQNLRGEGPFELVIVTVPKFKPEAQRLADFRASYDQLSVKVVTIQEVYNEFSSGAKDVTAIRDYMRYLYNLDGGSKNLKYLLLFGKGSYDIKNKIPGGINLIPTYQSYNSLHPIYSYSSDDYFCFLDDEEGEWVENSMGDHLMDISVGRLPVRNLQDARNITDKLIRYSQNQDGFGRWRKEIFFIAEDGDGNLHHNDADKLATLVDSTHMEFNVNKIFMGAYPQEILGNDKRTAPEVNQAINDAIKSGALIVNYTGHGGLASWANARILDTTIVSRWTNINKLPLFVTATCEFGKHDDAISRSGGEHMLFLNKGGAIGLVTSARPVFSSTNYALNLAFYNFAFNKVENEYATLGYIFKETKNNSLKGSVNRNFSLLGDPSMKLAYPKENLIITSINNSNSTNEGPEDTLKALSKVNIKGEVIGNSNTRLQSFNGNLSISVYDKETTTTTLSAPVINFKQRNSIIFRGQATVTDGTFEVEFIVPKNISYTLDKGKISLYAIDKVQGVDAGGVNGKVKIGGSDPNSESDHTPPTIELFMNDTTFRNGGITSSNSLLLAKIYDESGISISNTVGQNITAVLNDQKVFNLNEFFETEPDNFQVGWLAYPINDLPVGKNTIKLKAWDTHNNSQEAFLEFYVTEDAKLYLANVINYPNPFSEKTTFQIDHNAAGEDLDLNILIYSIKGELIRSINKYFSNAPARINELEWDGRNSVGQELDDGVYIYKIFIRSESTGLKNQLYKRLIIKK